MCVDHDNCIWEKRLIYRSLKGIIGPLEKPRDYILDSPVNSD